MPGLLNTEQQPVTPETQIPGVATEDESLGQQSSQPLDERIEPPIRDQMNEKQNKELDRVLSAGMKLIFGKETHEQLFSNIRPEDEIPIEDELGAAATNIMLVMFQKSGNSIPGEVIIPAGTILLARATDYINEAGIAQVTDEQFGSAVELYSDMIQAKLNPEYEQKMQAGQQQQQQQSPTAQPVPVEQTGTQQGGY